MAQIGDAIRIKIDGATHTGFITDADVDAGTFGAHIFLTPVDLTSEKDFHHVPSPMYGTGLRHALDVLKEGVEDGPRFVLAGEDEKLLEPAAPAAAVEAAAEAAAPDAAAVELAKPQQGELPEGFPGKSALAKAEVHTFAGVRKHVKAGTLTDIKGIGDPTAADIADALANVPDSEE
jgi:hypothetical protein